MSDEPDAMVLSTADDDGQPSGRFVLLKAFDARGFVFYTNLQSRKAQALRVNPRASLCAYWPALGKQVRIEGTVEPVTDAEADAVLCQPSARLADWRLGVEPESAAGITTSPRRTRRRTSARASTAQPSRVRRSGPATGWFRALSSSGRAMPRGCTCANASSTSTAPGSRPCSFPDLRPPSSGNPTATRPVRPPGDGNPAVGPSHFSH